MRMVSVEDWAAMDGETIHRAAAKINPMTRYVILTTFK
jgi:hypothetical protein